MKKAIGVSVITIGVCLASAYMVGYTVDQHIEKYINGMADSTTTVLRTSIPDFPAERISVDILNKERKLFSTHIDARLMLTAQGKEQAEELTRFDFDIHHGPFWFEKDSTGSRSLVHGLFGLVHEFQYDIGSDKISAVLNVKHNFLHSGSFYLDLHAEGENNLSITGRAGANYKTHWKHKSFTATESFVEIDHASADSYTLDDFYVKNTHPMGGAQFINHDGAVEVSLDSIANDRGMTLHDFSVENSWNLNDSRYDSKSELALDELLFVHGEGKKLHVKDLSITSESSLPHIASTSMFDPLTMDSDEFAKHLDQLKVDLDLSMVMNDEPVGISMQLKNDIDLLKTKHEDLDHASAMAMNNQQYALVYMRSLTGNMAIDWPDACVDSPVAYEADDQAEALAVLRPVCTIKSVIDHDTPENIYQVEGNRYLFDMEKLADLFFSETNKLQD